MGLFEELDSKKQSINFLPDGRHGESLETVKHIKSWANTEFPFSLNDGWGRFGLLGVLSQLFLLPLQDTHIIEIGTGESSVYLTETARRLNRKIFYCDAAVGKMFNPLTIKGYLHEDNVFMKTGSLIDYSSAKGIVYCGLSDDFFKDLEFPKIGFAFIDGEHHYEYVKRDFENIFKLLVPNGVICFHDTYPPDESYVLSDYCADSYKIRQELEKDNRVDCFTFSKMVGCNVGITMVRKRPENLPYYQSREM
jgi:hypothetical protein